MMEEEKIDHQCLSSAEVEPGQLKRCIMARHHLVNEFVKHMWVEAGNRSDGGRLIVEWDDQRSVTRTEYALASQVGEWRNPG